MKFLHIGINICGIPSSIARAQNTIPSDKATVLGFVPEQGHEADIEIPTWHPVKMTKSLYSIGKEYDVFHFHCITCTKCGIDLLLWKLLGKKVIIHYHGSEIRNKKQLFFHKLADAIFVSTPDLLKDVPNATWLPNPIFAEDYPKKQTEGMIIAHAPTNPEIKGTSFIQNVMPNINKKFPTVTLDLITNVPYKEAIQRYSKATIMIDQLLVGWYGMVSLEAMAMKIPVICYIKPELEDYLGIITPLKITDINMLEPDLTNLLQDEKSRNEIAEEGYKYVTWIHNPKRIQFIINQTLGLYAERYFMYQMINREENK